MLPNQPKKRRVSDPAPFPRCMRAAPVLVSSARRTIAGVSQHPAPPELGSSSAWWECRTPRRVKGGSIRLYRLFGGNSGPPGILEWRLREGQSNCRRGTPGGGTWVGPRRLVQVQCRGRLAFFAEVSCFPARFAVRGCPVLRSRLGETPHSLPWVFPGGEQEAMKAPPS